MNLNRPLQWQPALPSSSKPKLIHTETPIQQPKFSGLLGDGFTAMLAQNHMLSRVFIEFMGYTGWNVALARNNWEKFERAMDSVSWVVIGLGLPILWGKAMVPVLNKRLLKAFPKAFSQGKSIRPLALPFEWLEKAGFKKRFLPNSPISKRLWAYGLKSLPEKMANQIMDYKLFAIMMADYVGLWAKANLYAWGKNWFTAKFSHKEGFSGVFNIASQEYRHKETEAYEKNKRKKMLLSVGLGFLGSISFPFILRAALKSPTKMGAKGLMGWFKSKLPFFNYSNIVYMSKYALMWQVFWNWNLAGMMAARDKNERRENMCKFIAGDFFFFVGDDFFSGYLGKFLQKRYQKQLKGFKLMHSQRGLFGNPEVKGFHHLVIEANRLRDPAQRRLVKNLGKIILASGITATALCLGISMTLLTQWFTRIKIRREEQIARLKKHNAPKQPVKEPQIKSTQPRHPVQQRSYSYAPGVIPVTDWRTPDFSPFYRNFHGAQLAVPPHIPTRLNTGRQFETQYPGI